MWTAWLLLTLNGLFFTLRLSSGSGSFPRALKREEEAEYLKRMAEGDEDARSALIEHNLRLVAHIIKKGCPSRKLFLGVCKARGSFRETNDFLVSKIEGMKTKSSSKRNCPDDIFCAGLVQSIFQDMRRKTTVYVYKDHSCLSPENDLSELMRND